MPAARLSKYHTLTFPNQRDVDRFVEWGNGGLRIHNACILIVYILQYRSIEYICLLRRSTVAGWLGWEHLSVTGVCSVRRLSPTDQVVKAKDWLEKVGTTCSTPQELILVAYWLFVPIWQQCSNLGPVKLWFNIKKVTNLKIGDLKNVKICHCGRWYAKCVCCQKKKWFMRWVIISATRWCWGMSSKTLNPICNTISAWLMLILILSFSALIRWRLCGDWWIQLNTSCLQNKAFCL